MQERRVYSPVSGSANYGVFTPWIFLKIIAYGEKMNYEK
jgi:hypothetical protein